MGRRGGIGIMKDPKEARKAIAYKTFVRRGKDCMRAIYMTRTEYLKLSMEKKIPPGRRIIVTPDVKSMGD